MILFSTVEIVLVAAAVIPAVALMLYVYRKDHLEKEPTPLLWRLIVQGVVATALAVFAERLGAKVLSGMVNEKSLLYAILFYGVVVGLSEEGFKYLLLKRRTWNSPDFNCRFDGVVYAVFVSMGFALWENIDYVVMYGLQTAFVRALTAVPGHACFGVFMGAWYGLAKSHERHGNPSSSKFCRVMAVVCPALLHGVYDVIAALGGGSLSWIFVAFIAVMFLAAYGMVKRLSVQDRYL